MEFSWIITAILGVVLIFCIYWLKERNSNYWKEKGVPVIHRTNPFSLLFLDLLILRKSMSQIFSEMYKNLGGNKYGGYFQFFTPGIMIHDTELANRILIKDFTHFEDRGPPLDKDIDLFCMSLGNLTGDVWREARHKLTPTFTSGKLKTMFEPLKECSEEGILYLKDKNGHEFEARILMGQFIIKMIATVAFGLNVDTFNEKKALQNEFLKYIAEFFKPSYFFILKFMIAGSFPKLRRIFKFKLLDEEVNIFFKKTTKDIVKFRNETGTRKNDFLQLMMDIKKKEQLLKNENKLVFSNECEKEELEDKELLDQLKNTPRSSSNWPQSKELFTDEFIAAQTFAFISGGSETTASALSFVLYHLAMDQDVQKRAKKEVIGVLSSHEFNFEAVKKMVYLEQIINETFRLHSVTSAMVRYCTKDYTIPGTGITLEKGCIVNIPNGCLQKDPQYFPDPEKFNPDRFEDMNAIPKGVFFPFGSGPRMCIAMRLAILEMKIVLASLLSNYTVTISEKTKVPLKIMRNSIFNKVEGGIWIKFEENK